MKKEYSAPELEVFGTVSDLTLTGFTQAGADGNFNEQKGYEGSVCPTGDPFNGSGC